MKPGARASIVFCTAENADRARSIASRLVEERLAACVNVVGPVTSIYRWQGVVETTDEHLLIIKTKTSLLEPLEQRIRELHGYEIPEVLGVRVSAGAQPYLDWLFESTLAPAVARRKKRR